jgi:hypothetical protein
MVSGEFRGRQRRNFDAAEQAAALQVGTHDLRQARADRGLAGERDDRDRAALRARIGDDDF